MRTEQTWYSTKTWKRNYWKTLTFNIMMDEVLAQLEKKNVGNYVWEPGVAQPGMDNADTPLRRILTNLEK